MRSLTLEGVAFAVTAMVAACTRPTPTPPVVARAPAASTSTLVDRRDGTVYRILKVGTQRWISQNMRFATPKSRCYDDRDDLCARLGRLYDWREALEACPAGWRLASDVDWQELEMSAGMSAVDVFKADARGDGIGDRLDVDRRRCRMGVASRRWGSTVVDLALDRSETLSPLRALRRSGAVASALGSPLSPCAKRRMTAVLDRSCPLT